CTSCTNDAAYLVLLGGEQRNIPADRGSIDRHDLFASKSPQVIRSARLRARAGETAAAKRLRPHHRTDHVAVHIDVAMWKPRCDPSDRSIDARMNAESECIAASRNVIEQSAERIGLPANNVQDRP